MLKINFSRYMSILILLVLMISTIEGGIPELESFNKEKFLQDLGYPTDTIEQILKHTKNKSLGVRISTLGLLKDRIGIKAIPALKEALDDNEFDVRWRAAYYLGILGDMSGLERMRKDLKELAPNNGAHAPTDPNIKDPGEIKEMEGKRNHQLYQALFAAQVLVELGNDWSGYELATKMALEGERALQRRKAVSILMEIAKADERILVAEGKDPVFILCAVAESEKDSSVFTEIVYKVEKLRADIALKILEKAVNSPHQSKLMHKIAQRVLDKIRSNMSADTNK